MKKWCPWRAGAARFTVVLPAMVALSLLSLLFPAAASEPPKSPLPSPGFPVDRHRWDLGRPTRPYGASYRGPIIDTHTHFFDRGDRLKLDEVLAEMTRAGIARLIVLPTPNEGRYSDAGDNAAARRRFVRLVGSRGGRLCGSTYLTTWMNQAYRSGYEEKDLAERLARLDRDLDKGGCLGVGEIGPYHFEKHDGQYVVTFPMNFPPMARLAQLAARRGVWLDLHAEPVTRAGASYEDQVFGGIAYLFRQAPSLKMISSHTAMTNPHNARALLEKYPGLMMNLKIVLPGRDLAWDNLGPIVDRDGALFEDWAALFEAMPDRFMIGTDARFGTRKFSSGKYARQVEKIRRLLGALAPAAAERIAWRNADRLWPGAPVSEFANTVPVSTGAGKHRRHRHGSGSGRHHRE